MNQSMSSNMQHASSALSNLSLGQHIGIILSESYYEILKAIRQPGFVFPVISFPIMFYVFFGILFNHNGMDGQIPTYMMITYGTFGVIGPALFSFGVGVAMEKSQGWFDLKQASPIPPSAYVLARMSLAMLFALVITLGLFSIGALFGGVQLIASDWILIALTLVLGAIPFCAIGLFLGMSLKSQTAPAVVNLIYLPMSFLSGLWVPIQAFPTVLQNMAQLFPPYHLAQLTLKIVELDMGVNIWRHIVVLLAYSLVFGWFSLRAYYRIRTE